MNAKLQSINIRISESEMSLKRLAEGSPTDREAFSGQAKVIVKDVQFIEAKSRID